MNTMEILKNDSKQCYNCSNEGSTSEHIIPQFLLCPGEEGLTIPCCNMCQKALNWLDAYGADYFRFHRSQIDIAEWEKWFKQRIRQNGSPMSLRTFGEDTVIDENLLMYFIQKICVGTAFHLFGKLDDTYRLHVYTNFSKLGGYCQYNNPNDKSYTQEQTIKTEKARDMAYHYFKEIVDAYGTEDYKVKNAVISYTKQILYGARWFHISLYNKFNFVCAVADGNPSEYDQARNMIVTSFSAKINLDDLALNREKTGLTDHGDSLAYILAGSPISEESRRLRYSSLKEQGVSDTDIEIFETSLLDFMNNKGGREGLAERFREHFTRK